MTAPTTPDLKGFKTYYGLQVSDIGEDGDLIILGHHHHDPLRVIAALNRHARTHWSLTNLIDKPGAEVADLACSVYETHAVLRTECDDPDHEADCVMCREVADADWWIEWNRTAEEPGAFPVTMWRP